MKMTAVLELLLLVYEDGVNDGQLNLSDDLQKMFTLLVKSIKMYDNYSSRLPPIKIVTSEMQSLRHSLRFF